MTVPLPSPPILEPFQPRLRAHFYRLNAAWLERYFEIEPLDRELLENPERTILELGGTIWFARLDDEVVGTGALLRESAGVYELGKMAVAEHCRGYGIGRLLLLELIAEFHRRGGRELFLESNSRLVPALRLYESMGFEHQSVPRAQSHYARADVYMIYRPPLAASS